MRYLGTFEAAFLGAAGALIVEFFRIAKAAAEGRFVPRPSLVALAEVLLVGAAAVVTSLLVAANQVSGPVAAVIVGAATPLLIQHFAALVSLRESRRATAALQSELSERLGEEMRLPLEQDRSH